MVRCTPTSLRGHFAGRMRTLAESTGMSLAKLLKETLLLLLVYECEIEAGYEPGASLGSWAAEQEEPHTDA